VGNCLILAAVLACVMVFLSVAGWWLWTVYGLMGMKTFFRSADATIISSKVVFHEGSIGDGRSAGRPPSWEVRLLYRYEVNGQAYEGYRYTPVLGDSFSQAEAQRIVGNLPPGQSVAIRYDPLMPSQCAIADDCQGRAIGPLIFIPGIFVFGAAILWYNRREARQSGRTPDPRPWTARFKQWMTSSRDDARARGPFWALPLITLVFSIGGIVIMAKAFTPRDASQVSMGTAGQLLFGAIFFFLGLAGLGFAINRFGARQRK
jgi:hypothetical protein